MAFIKIQANEAAPFSSTGAKSINFDIPADLNVVDLENAYVLMKMSVTTTETEANHANALRPVAFGSNETPYSRYDSDCMIAHSRFDCATAGNLDPDTEVNVLNHALNFYGKSSEDMASETVYNGSFLFDENGRPHSVFRKLNYLSGSTAQTVTNNALTDGVRYPEIPIPLKRLTKLADGMTQFPIMATGDCRLHVELQDSAVPVVQAYDVCFSSLTQAYDLSGAEVNDFTFTDRADLGDDYQIYAGAPVTITYDTITGAAGLAVQANSDQLYWQCSNNDFDISDSLVTISGTDLTVTRGDEASIQGLTLDLSFTNPAAPSASNPFGQTVLVVDVCAGSNGIYPDNTFTYTHPGGTVFSFGVLDTEAARVADGSMVHTQVSSLSRDATGNVSITTADPIPAQASHHACNILVTVPPHAGVTSQVDEASIVVPRVPMTADQVSKLQQNVNKGISIPYMVWETERADVYNNSRAFDRDYRLPPKCGNVIIVKPARDNLVNERDNLTSYRYKLNGINTTDYDIEVGEPLYHDRIVECWANMNKDLKNLDEEYTLDTREVAYENPRAISCQPVPLLDQESILSYSATSDNGFTGGTIYCFKQKQRVLSITGNRTEIQN